MISTLISTPAMAVEKNIPQLAISSEETPATWISLYKEAQSISKISLQKSCDAYTKLKDKTLSEESKKTIQEAQELLALRTRQTCKPDEFHLKSLEKWLQKDAIFFGLRQSVKNPVAFVQYYEAYNKLDALEKQQIDFLERYRLSKVALETAKKKKDVSTEEKIRKLMPVFFVLDGKKIPEDSKFEAAYGLRMTRNFLKAKKIYKDLIKTNQAQFTSAKNKKEKLQAYLKISKAQELLRITYRVEEEKVQGILEYKKAVIYFKTTFQQMKTKEYATVYTDHLVQLARDLWTEGQIQEGRKLLEEAIQIVTSSYSLDQVYWVLGRMKQEERKYSESVEFFKKALSVNEDKDFALKLQWLIAWNLKKENKTKESVEEFEVLSKMAKKNLSDVYNFKALYWKAQSLRDEKNMEDYKDILRKISEENFFGYYGRLAALELGESSYFESVPKESNEKYDADFIKKIKFFKHINETDILSSLIEGEWRSLGKSNRGSFSKKKEFSYYYQAAEFYKQNQQFIEIFSFEDKLELFKEHPSFFFPIPHLPLVQQHAQKFKVPQEIVFSLMRQESLFDPKARSPADAFGLLQLIPRIAKLNQKDTGISIETPEDLYEPAIIIPLGVAHLSKLILQFKGSLLLTAASYNAGVLPVRGWLKSRNVTNIFEFIEDIPYAETESYVKLVFRNLSFYSLFSAEWNAEERMVFLKNYFVLNKEFASGN